MKRIYLILAALLIVVSGEHSFVYADAWAKKRGCGLFHKRYKVHAHTRRRAGSSTIANNCDKTDKTCNSGGRYVFCRSSNSDGPFTITYAEAEAESSISEFYANHWAAYDFDAGYDVTHIIPDLSFSPMIVDGKDNYRSGNISAKYVEFDYETRNIILRDIEGTMTINSSDFVVYPKCWTVDRLS